MRGREVGAVPDSFAEFVAARQGALRAFARVLVARDADAEDLVQEALARCVPAWSRIEGDPEPYVRTVMVRQNITRWRRKKVAEVAEPVGESWHPRSTDAHGAWEARESIGAALAQLPPRQRTAVVLRHVEDRSERETAEMMGCSVGTVKSQTHAGLKALRALLAGSSTPGPGGLPRLTTLAP